MQIINVNLVNYQPDVLTLNAKENPNQVCIEFLPGSDNDISSLSITGIQGISNDLTVNFVEKCTPDNAVYVRWINTIGGYEYAMFSSRITNTLKTSGLETFIPVISNFDSVSSLQMVLNRNAENLLTLGIYQQPREEYLRLRGMLITPKIDVYDPISKSWLGSIVTNQTYTYETSNTLLSDFEVEIRLNERILQTLNVL